MNWVATAGNFTIGEDQLVFQGQPTPFQHAQKGEQMGYALGIAICDEVFTGGELSADVRFDAVDKPNTFEFIVHHYTSNYGRLLAGIGAPSMFTIRVWNGEKHITYAETGDRSNMVAGRNYHLRVSVAGSRVTLFVDDVEVLTAILPFTVPASQPGVACFDDGPITISNFKIKTKKGTVFAVLKLSSPYLEIYEEVIKKICEERYVIRNAEEMYGPGLIMADVANDIIESEFVVADITPINANVYYEVGYAHALRKPVILVADKAEMKDLPFDVRTTRVVFYENTILGKRQFEESFRKTLAAIEQSAGPRG